MLSLLLKKKPHRLGNRGVKEVQKHPWLEGIEWENVLKYKIKAPFIPETKGDHWLSNFEEITETSNHNDSTTTSISSQRSNPVIPEDYNGIFEEFESFA